MRIRLSFLAIPVLAAAVCLPVLASAHTGGPLDADGCHADHRTGTYHCHRGAAAGYTFPNREAMLEAVRTGKFPEKTVDEESFFSKLWPWGKHHHEQMPTEAPASPDAAPAAGAPPAATPGTAPTGSAAPAGTPGIDGQPPAATSGTDREREVSDKLKVLQGLYEMGLITKDEYEGRRKAILDQI